MINTCASKILKLTRNSIFTTSFVVAFIPHQRYAFTKQILHLETTDRPFESSLNKNELEKEKSQESPYNALSQQITKRFHEGDSYTWLYKQKSDNKATCWERYTIKKVDHPHLTIEMASKFTEADFYNTHHRMIINLNEQLNAVYDKQDWELLFEYNHPEKGWIKFGNGKNVQAFEEKFNVFLMPPSLQRSIVGCKKFALNENDFILAAKPERHAYTDSWYGFDSNLAGVALSKDFGEYSFSLIEYKSGGITKTSCIGPI